MITVLRSHHETPQVISSSFGGHVSGPQLEVTVAGGREGDRGQAALREAATVLRSHGFAGVTRSPFGPRHNSAEGTSSFRFATCSERDSLVNLWADETTPEAIAQHTKAHTVTATVEVTLVLRDGVWAFDGVHHYADSDVMRVSSADCECGNSDDCAKAEDLATHVPFPDNLPELHKVLDVEVRAQAKQARETRKQLTREYRAAAKEWRRLQFDGQPIEGELVDQLREREQTLASLARQMPHGLAAWLHQENRAEMLLWRADREGVPNRLQMELDDLTKLITYVIRTGESGPRYHSAIVRVPHTLTDAEQEELEKRDVVRYLGQPPTVEDLRGAGMECSYCEHETAVHELHDKRVLVRDFHRHTSSWDKTAGPGYFVDEIDRSVHTGMLIEHSHSHLL